jgi:multicomponent Na+:H+ antiporter subunit E
MPRRDPIGIILTATILFLFWIVLSGHLDWVHLSMGLISSFIIAYLFPIVTVDGDMGNLRRIGGITLGIVPYFIRLQYEIIRANIDIIRIIPHPDLPISPAVRKFSTDLLGSTALATFGNSMTLTPGTLTIDIEEEGDCYIHYLTRPDEGQKKTQEIRNAVLRLFKGSEAWR